jgi:hypothetical protein
MAVGCRHDIYAAGLLLHIVHEQGVFLLKPNQSQPPEQAFEPEHVKQTRSEGQSSSPSALTLTTTFTRRARVTSLTRSTLPPAHVQRFVIPPCQMFRSRLERSIAPTWLLIVRFQRTRRLELCAMFIPVIYRVLADCKFGSTLLMTWLVTRRIVWRPEDYTGTIAGDINLVCHNPSPFRFRTKNTTPKLARIPGTMYLVSGATADSDPTIAYSMLKVTISQDGAELRNASVVRVLPRVPDLDITHDCQVGEYVNNTEAVEGTKLSHGVGG